MKPLTGVIATTIIVNACIWGFAIIMCSISLSGTGGYEKIQNILGGCAGVSLAVVGGGLAMLRKKAGDGR